MKCRQSSGCFLRRQGDCIKFWERLRVSAAFHGKKPRRAVTQLGRGCGGAVVAQSSPPMNLRYLVMPIACALLVVQCIESFGIRSLDVSSFTNAQRTVSGFTDQHGSVHVIHCSSLSSDFCSPLAELCFCPQVPFLTFSVNRRPRPTQPYCRLHSCTVPLCVFHQRKRLCLDPVLTVSN